VLARELDDRPALLVVENPTRGLDIRATVAVHDRLRAAAEAGTAVVVYSSDLDEVLTLAHRLLVIHAGTLRETSFDRTEIGRAMLGVA
jgi:general nucleoside transport system ATP-binding protein